MWPEISRYGGDRAVRVTGESVIYALPVVVDSVGLATFADGSDLRRRRRRPFHNVVAVVGRQVNHLQSGSLVGPEGLELALSGFEVCQSLRFRVDVNGLPVVSPAGEGFVEAAGESHAVAAGVLNDSALGMEDAVAANGDLHFHDAVGDQPVRQLQMVAVGDVGGFGQQEVFTAGRLLQGSRSVDLAVVDGLQHVLTDAVVADEADAPSVADEARSARRGGNQPIGGERVRGAVVANRLRQQGLVQAGEQVRAVPVVVHGMEGEFGEGHTNSAGE